ncbi:hypothetical protein [Pedobacter sp. MW01-1-1]|uniref:hypothetical protein n=1 Tax=Pedobacter sp. MW01-1-1 TaxID=3383027 RepID=UPI003FF0567E
MKTKQFFWTLSFALPFYLVSCGGDDLKNANAVAPVNPEVTKERTVGVEVIYSDSARVKAKGNAPIMDNVTPANGAVYQEMPKGVKIYFYNLKNGAVDGTLVSDYAIRQMQEQKTIFKKNVVVKNAQGSTFSSEELIWDESRKLFFSTQMVYIKTIEGNEVQGIDFEAPQDFSSYKLNQSSGQFTMKDQLAP